MQKTSESTMIEHQIYTCAHTCIHSTWTYSMIQLEVKLENQVKTSSQIFLLSQVMQAQNKFKQYNKIHNENYIFFLSLQSVSQFFSQRQTQLHISGLSFQKYSIYSNIYKVHIYVSFVLFRKLLHFICTVLHLELISSILMHEGMPSFIILIFPALLR